MGRGHASQPQARRELARKALHAATLIIPATTARMLTDSFARLLFLSATLGAGAGALGMYASYWLDISSGATIVLLEAIGFGLAFAWSALRRRRGTWEPSPSVSYPATTAYDDV